jgi:hypothetical protein
VIPAFLVPPFVSSVRGPIAIPIVSAEDRASAMEHPTKKNQLPTIVAFFDLQMLLTTSSSRRSVPILLDIA